jgi:hypothetical protein
MDLWDHHLGLFDQLPIKQMQSKLVRVKERVMSWFLTELYSRSMVEFSISDDINFQNSAAMSMVYF